jgi:hypothetical protein
MAFMKGSIWLEGRVGGRFRFGFFLPFQGGAKKIKKDIDVECNSGRLMDRKEPKRLFH